VSGWSGFTIVAVAGGGDEVDMAAMLLHAGEWDRLIPFVMMDSAMAGLAVVILLLVVFVVACCWLACAPWAPPSTSSAKVPRHDTRLELLSWMGMLMLPAPP
jgi:hypothetical protein